MNSLIINSPFVAPAQHWQQAGDGTLTLVDGRRQASYEIFDVRNNTRRTEPLPLVNQIRERVDQWRADGYPGVTQVTRSLLDHWNDADAPRQYAFYFCQIEAIETLIWWVEASADYKQGIYVPGDGGAWERLCNKMATGSGKTTVMAMIITWQVLNALAYPKRNKDFSQAIFIVAPGLTVKDRLRVLYPGEVDNYYDQFSLAPSESMRQKLNQMELLIENWHTLMPLKEPERSVVKKGKESDEAFTRRVLGKLAAFKDIAVINDEAHHAYRIPAETKYKKSDDFDPEEATRWIEGLDRINKTRRIAHCFDLSATPFAPTGKTNTEAGLFDWIVSDFGLNDAIEGGLVKTPRVVVRDGALANSQTLKPKLYHLYREEEVSQDLNRKAEPHEALPKLVQDAYTLLGADWLETAKAWREGGHKSPPVMLTVCNRTETAARIEHYFNAGGAFWPELQAPNRTLRVDSRVLEKAEVGESSGTDKDYEACLHAIVDAADIPVTRKERLDGMKKEELLRELVDTVGKYGRAGQDLQNVISVAMLSEGWDAKNVTHIMGLRAFTSQLLCEQVIGRGLRRVGYEKDENGLFTPEFVNVFGVPLSIYQDVGGGDSPPPPKPSTQIESLPDRRIYEIRWPNVLRVDEIVTPLLSVDWISLEPLILDPAKTPISAELAPALGGAADLSRVTKIDLELLAEDFRLQRFIFGAASRAYQHMQGQYQGTREYLLFQLVKLVEAYLASGKIQIPSLFHQEEVRRNILYALNMDLIVSHLLRKLREDNVERLEPVFDAEQPIGSTAYMRTWYTTKPCDFTRKSQISHVVIDGTWEKYVADALESSALADTVLAYAKNDHLGFNVYYLWNGSKRRFIPDYLIRLANGKTLVLEVKGVDSSQNAEKRAALDLWVKAVNVKGGFGTFVWDVIFEPAQIYDAIKRLV